MLVPLHLIESMPLSSNIWNIKKEAWLCFWKQGNKLLTTESIVSVGVSTHSAGLKKRTWLCVMQSYAFAGSPAVPLLLFESTEAFRTETRRVWLYIKPHHAFVSFTAVPVARNIHSVMSTQVMAPLNTEPWFFVIPHHAFVGSTTMPVTRNITTQRDTKVHAFMSTSHDATYYKTMATWTSGPCFS